MRRVVVPSSSAPPSPSGSSFPPPPALPCPPGLDACTAVAGYDGPMGEVLRSVKFGGRRLAALGLLADALAGAQPPPAGAVVTWAPTTPSRRRRRGFDQAELLARAVARRWGRPCRGLLTRREGPHQTGRPAAQRHLAPAFSAAGPAPACVVVVDDVVTTGATLAAAARALRGAGAQRVEALVAARTA